MEESTRISDTGIRKKRIRYSIIIVIVTVFVIGSWVAIERKPSELPPPKSTSEAGIRFAGALQENNQLAYELSVRALWPKIDEWMATHTAQYCHSYPFENFGGGGRGNDQRGSEDVFVQCKLENGDIYYFEVYDIEVEFIDGKYLVTSWGDVIEKTE